VLQQQIGQFPAGLWLNTAVLFNQILEYTNFSLFLNFFFLILFV